MSGTLRLVHAESVVESAVLTDQNDDVLDRRCGLRRFPVIAVVVSVIPVVSVLVVLSVIVVLSVVVVLILIAVMRVRACVPVASARIGSVGDRSDCQRRYDAQRRSGAPSLFKLVISFQCRPLLRVKFTPLYLIVEHDGCVSDF